MIAQLSVYPIGEGTSLSRFVKKGVSVIEESGYPYEIGGMSTSIEVPDRDALFEGCERWQSDAPIRNDQTRNVTRRQYAALANGRCIAHNSRASMQPLQDGVEKGSRNGLGGHARIDHAQVKIQYLR